MKYNEEISERSLWLTQTPTPLALTLPFYAAEAGHFIARKSYSKERDFHDSFLLIYTLGGCGNIISGGAEITLRDGSAAIIDCRSRHKYSSASAEWDFYWIHFNGSAAKVFFDILYPSKPYAVLTENDFGEKLFDLIRGIGSNDTAASLSLSLGLHSVLCSLIRSAMESAQAELDHTSNADIAFAEEFIRRHYGENIKIDDIVSELHISKYHFIRLFSRIMGTTPYSYLTSYRINTAKILLRSTDKSVAEIAAECGFSDTSNFITHFKKRIGESPSQYRRDFDF